MKNFSFTFEVRADLPAVWNFYTDLRHLDVITPKALRLRVVRSSCGHAMVEGADVWLDARPMIFHLRWHTKITLLRPYRYEDEMISGPFKTWKHIHDFRTVEPGVTLVADSGLFELPYGPLGGLFEGYAYSTISKIFQARKQATISALETGNPLEG
ncbi:MAG: SRPBCC family protein [Nitrososphaera sp.]